MDVAIGTQKHRVILDTDPGVDDALAIFVALAHLQIEGITIVGTGNHDDLNLLAVNACKIVELSNTKQTPNIYKGSNVPLEGVYKDLGGKLCHGANGLGNVVFEVPKNLHLIIESMSAEEYIIKTCMENPNEITIITLGPFTNLANAIKLKPEITQYIKHVYAMGGSINHPGNVSPVSEANIMNDDVAAKLVFNSGVEITLCPLNLTEILKCDPLFLVEMKNLGNIGHFIFQTHEFFIDVIVGFGECTIETVPMHDVSPIMVLLLPSLFQSVKVYVDVETKGELTKGQLIADYGNFYKNLLLIRFEDFI